MYSITGTITFPQITLGAFIYKSILDKWQYRDEIVKKYNIAILNHFGIYKLSI